MAEDTAAGFTAAEEFVAASGRVRGLMDRMARGDVQQVRVAARRALGEAARAMGGDTVAGVAEDREDLWRQHTQVAIGHLRSQLKAQWVRRVALTAAYPESPAQRYAELAIAEARLDSTREMAELLLSPEDYGLLLDTLPLTEHFRR